jgi:hypothetical protein
MIYCEDCGNYLDANEVALIAGVKSEWIRQITTTCMLKFKYVTTKPSGRKHIKRYKMEEARIVILMEYISRTENVTLGIAAKKARQYFNERSNQS